jgi:serine/threonine protein phosphatase PrpC
MVFQGSSAAISHTGRVRSNNQDSGYSGSNLFVVADGMGGHAGGDVASAIAIDRIQRLDHHFETTAEAEVALRTTITSTAQDLIEAAQERPQLAGLGTTVSGIVMVDEYAVIGHIGDSRIYLFRDGALTQITTDHTFVQRLVETGRITPEEARYHPRRSVLMRVLGDMDANPEVDTFIMPTRPGDRWLLCSDGLSGVVDEPHIAKVFGRHMPPARTADALLKQALDGGAPDNVTVVIVDVGGQHPLYTGTPTIVGSASNPDGVIIPASKSLLPTGWLHPQRAAANEPLRARHGVPRGAHRGGQAPRAPPAHRRHHGDRAPHGGDRRGRVGVLRLDPDALLRRHRRGQRRDLSRDPAVDRADLVLDGVRGHADPARRRAERVAPAGSGDDPGLVARTGAADRGEPARPRARRRR